MPSCTNHHHQQYRQLSRACVGILLACIFLFCLASLATRPIPFRRIGEASNPGPTDEQAPAGYLLEIANVSHLANQANRIKGRAFDAMVVSEHSLTPAQQIGLREQLGKNCFYHLTPLIDDLEHQVGGVGVIMRATHPICPKIHNAHLATLSMQGRVHLYGLDIGRGVIVHVYQVYGVTNGTNDKQAASITNSIIRHVLKDMEMQANLPVLITGDLNAELSKLEDVQDALDDHRLCDLGAIASAFGGVDHEHTCQVNVGATRTRRDYALANSMALDLIKTFRVDHNSGLPVHSVIQIEFHTRPDSGAGTYIRLPYSLHNNFINHIRKLYSTVNIERSLKKHTAARANDKTFHCDVNLPPDPSDFNTGQPNRGSGLAEQVIHITEEMAAQDLESANLQAEDEATQCLTHEQINAQLHQLHAVMDQHLHEKQHWDDLLRTGDTGTYLASFAECIEHAVLQFTGTKGTDAQKHRGRGTLNLQAKAFNLPPKHVMHEGTTVRQFGPTLTRLQDQSARLRAIKTCLAKNRAGSCDVSAAARKVEIARNAKAFLHHHQTGDPGTEMLEILKHPHPAHYFAICRGIQVFEVNLKALYKSELQHRRRKSKMYYNSNKLHGRVSQALRKAGPAPMTVLRRPCDMGPGRPKGSLATNPKEKDAILHMAWDPITNGNVSSCQDDADAFINKYAAHLPCHPEY